MRICSWKCAQLPALLSALGQQRVEPTGVKLWSRLEKMPSILPKPPAVREAGGGGLRLPAKPSPPYELRFSSPSRNVQIPT